MDFLIHNHNAANKLATGTLTGCVIGARPDSKGQRPRTARLIDHFVPPTSTFEFLQGGNLQKRAFAIPAPMRDPTIEALKAVYAAGPQQWRP